MPSSDSDESLDKSECSGNSRAPSPLLSGGCSESLGLMVLLSLLRSDGERESYSGATEFFGKPRNIGRFKLEGLLGKGAYGAVFRAHDSHLDRRVALKVAWPGVLMDPVTSRRFTDEPKIVAALKHPGIVEVFDSGNVDLAWFIALELIDGPNLAEWVTDQRVVPFRLAAEIVRDIAGTIHFAHEHGVVHRDLKPSNILLRPKRLPGALPFDPVVTDFGLAHRPTVASGSVVTATQAILGTDQYMSPEQVRGVSSNVGPSSDVFSLGVILYELVAGQRPFDADTSDEIRRKIREEEAAPISRSRKGIPRDLVTIIHKCLENAPKRRYATAGGLAEDLARFLSGKPIAARRSGPLDRAWKFTKRNPAGVALTSALIFASLLVAGLLGAWVSDHLSAAEQIATAQAATAIAEDIDRQHQYVSNIQHAAEALKHGKRREALRLLEESRGLVPANRRCGIEWDWISSEANRTERTLRAHAPGVSVVRFSPSGDYLASGGRDGKVILWSTKDWTKRCEWTYAGKGDVNTVEFSADGSLLAVGGDAGRLAVYKVDDRAVVYDESIINGRVFALAWIGDSTRIAVGGDGAILSIVDPVAREHRQKRLAISDESRAMASGHPTEITELFYLPSRHEIAAFLTPPNLFYIEPTSLEATIPTLAVIPRIGAACNVPVDSGYFAATAGDPVHVDLFDIHEGSIVGSVKLDGQLQAIRHCPKTRKMAVAFRDGAIQVCDFDAKGGRDLFQDRRLCAHQNRAMSADFSPDGVWLATGGWDSEIQLRKVASLQSAFDLPLSAHPHRLEFSPCGHYFAVAVEYQIGNWQINVLDTMSGTTLSSMTFHTTPDCGLGSWSFDPTGSEIALAECGSVTTYESQTGRKKEIYNLSHNDSPTSVAYSHDRESFIVRWPYADALIVNRKTKAKHDDSVAFGRDSLGTFRTVYGEMWLDNHSAREPVLRMMDDDGPTLTLRGPSERLARAAVSPDGRCLTAGGHDGIVYYWNLENPGSQGKCIGHDAMVTDVRFTQDGRSIFSRSEDGTARLWDIATRAELLRFGSRERPILSMAFNDEGTLLVFGVKEGDRYGLRIHRLRENGGALLRSVEPF